MSRLSTQNNVPVFTNTQLPWESVRWYLQGVHALVCGRALFAHLVRFFGRLLGVVAADVGESHVFLLCALPLAYFCLHVQAHHQLVEHHTEDGAEKRDKDGNQEPAVANPEKKAKRCTK